MASRFTDTESKSIREAIAKHAHGGLGACVWCGKCDYTIGSGFAFFTEHRSVNAMTLMGDGMPCVALVCHECGHIEWFNLLTLGLESFIK